LKRNGEYAQYIQPAGWLDVFGDGRIGNSKFAVTKSFMGRMGL
jgi:hypothetical protein